MPRQLLEFLDHYIAERCPPGTGRPEAVRLALHDYLIGQGLIPADDDE